MGIVAVVLHRIVVRLKFDDAWRFPDNGVSVVLKADHDNGR
jgi:hypothetical protein